MATGTVQKELLNIWCNFMKKTFFYKKIVLFILSCLILVVCFCFLQKQQLLESEMVYSMSLEKQKFLVNSLEETQNEMLNAFDIPNYYKVYRKYEFSYFAKILEWFYDDYVYPQKEDLKILDIGCAYGTFLFYAKNNLPSVNLYCIDYVDGLISKELSNKKNVKFAVSNIETENIPFKEKFDVIIFTETLEHLNYNSVSSLKKIRASLKDDGVLFLSTPDSSSGWGVTKKYYAFFDKLPDVNECLINKKCTYFNDHIWQYNITELLDVINKSGFKVVKLEYTFSNFETKTRHFNLKLKKSNDSL